MCKFFRPALALLLGCFVVINTQAKDRGVPASHGITNFGQVNEHLYRGAQPNTNGIATLKSLGVKTIICLRLTNDLWLPEKAEAENNGINYINIPLRGLGATGESDVERALAAIEKSPGPVFVHCEHGCDRTGTLVACYRIQHDQWSAADAQKEANHYGMSVFERGMKKFIVQFSATEIKKRQATIMPAGKEAVTR